jgi:hypothetical protein
MRELYIKSGQGFLLVFSITSNSSFFTLEAIYDQIVKTKALEVKINFSPCFDHFFKEDEDLPAPISRSVSSDPRQGNSTIFFINDILTFFSKEKV